MTKSGLKCWLLLGIRTFSPTLKPLTHVLRQHQQFVKGLVPAAIPPTSDKRAVGTGVAVGVFLIVSVVGVIQ